MPSIVDNPAFKKWFGKSKVVDADGKPKVVYHGTSIAPRRFSRSRKGYASSIFGQWRNTRYGIFVAEDPRLAWEKAGSGHKSIMPLYARAENPIDLSKPLTTQQLLELENLAERWDHPNPSRFSQFINNATEREDTWEIFDDDNMNDPEYVIDAFKALGYDSAIIKEPDEMNFNKRTWVLFEPTQVKSAVGNKGVFDPTDPNILKEASSNKKKTVRGFQLKDILRDIDEGHREDFLKHHYTGGISSDAYERSVNPETSHFAKYTKQQYPILNSTEQHGPYTVEFRQTGEKLQYVKSNPEDDLEFLRDPQGELVYYSDDEMKEKNLPFYDTTIVAFIGDKAVGMVSNEWGAVGVWVLTPFQKLGIGTSLLEKHIELRPNLKSGRGKFGQMTPAGQNLTLKYFDKMAAKHGEDWFKKLKKQKLTEYEKGEPLTFEHDFVDSYRGESFAYLIARDRAGNQVGYINYSVYNDEVDVKMILTKKDQRRKGIATSMVKELKQKYPNHKIHWGLSTESGEKLLKKTGDLSEMKNLKETIVTHLLEILNEGLKLPDPSLQSNIKTQLKTLGKFLDFSEAKQTQEDIVQWYTSNKGNIVRYKISDLDGVNGVFIVEMKGGTTPKLKVIGYGSLESIQLVLDELDNKFPKATEI